MSFGVSIKRGVILTYRIKVTLSTAWTFFPINYAADLRKLSFLSKRRTHPLSTANVMDTLFDFKQYHFLRKICHMSQRHRYHSMA